MAEPELKSFQQVGERLHCRRTKIYELIAAGRLEVVKLGRSTLVTERSIRELEMQLLKEAKRGAIERRKGNNHEA